MISIPYEQIIEKIKEKSNLPEEEIQNKINQKLTQLSGLISKEGAAHIIANELGIKLLEQTSGKLQIKNILSGMRSVETVGKVQQVYEVREFQTNNRSGKVGSFMLADETGSIRIVCWGDQTDNLIRLTPNSTVKVVGGYVRDNNGRKEVHMNDKSKLIINPKGETVADYQSTPQRKKITELQEGYDNIEILGTIVQAFDPKFFEVCSVCSKRVQRRDPDYICAEHGKIAPVYSYVMSLFVDDGSDNIRAVFFRNQVENLLKKNAAELLTYKENPQSFEEIKNTLLGNIIKLNGRVSKNKLFDRLEFITNSVNLNPDPNEEIKRLTEEKSKFAT